MPSNVHGLRPARGLVAVGALAAAALLASCGGGGADAGEAPFGDAGSTFGNSGGSLPRASTLAQQCATDNPLAPTASRTATLDRERRWVRSYMNEAYLWYSEVPSVNTADPAFNLASVPDSLDNYFQALKTRATTASGKLKDEFSFTYPSAAYQALSESGIVAGFGAEWILRNPTTTTPREVRIAYVEPNTPAAAQNLTRGTTVISVNGVPINDNTDAGLATINEGLFSPVSGRQYTFVLADLGGLQRTVRMNATQITKTPVQNVRSIATANGNVGYLTFNDHIGPSEGQLIAAFTQLAADNVNDLVLDLRYNGGGALYIASQVGYMVAGATRSAGKTFDRLQFNDKRSADSNDPNNNFPFFSTASGFTGTGTTADAPLPALNVGKVYVLASPDTCSASEAIVNGLRGINVEVVLVGGTTCGKPYGFTAKDNCGLSYFPIEFRGVNDAGFGDYADGFAPSATCNVPDDFSRALGDSSEGMLAAALAHRATGSCSGTSAGRESAAARGIVSFGKMVRHPVRENAYRR